MSGLIMRAGFAVQPEEGKLDQYVEMFRRKASDQANTSDHLLLFDWTDAEWAKLLNMTTRQEYKTSEVVITRGVSDRTLFFVASGSLEVGVSFVDGVSISPLAKIGAGSVTGEQSFFDGEPRSANVWGVTDGVLLRLAYEDFHALAQREPAMARDFLFALGRILSLRLRHTSMRVRR